MEIALVSNDALPVEDFAYYWRACAIQLTRDFWPAWRNHLPVPAAANWPVVGYTKTTNLTAETYHPIVCVKDIDDPGTLGDHSGFRDVGVAFGRWRPDSTVASHEVMELAADPYCDVWKPFGDDGSVEACEVSDRTQFDHYAIDVDIAGDVRTVMVSNFLYPAAFGIGNGTKYDHMGLLSSPQENRGYAIVRRPGGAIDYVFASTYTEAQKQAIYAKASQPLSRTAQRIAKAAGEAAKRASDATTEMMRRKRGG